MKWPLSSELADILPTYGYGAVFGLVALDSAGLPLPGETALITAAIYAGTTHKLDVSLLFLFNACGGIAWAILYGVGAYSVGHTFHRLAGPARVVILVAGLVAIVIFWIVMRRRIATVRLEATQVASNRSTKPD